MIRGILEGMLGETGEDEILSHPWARLHVITAEFVARLPGGKIPDRNDFYRMPNDERLRVWRTVVDESRRLADELRELIATGRVGDAVRPL